MTEILARGTALTLCYPQDRYGLVVVSATKARAKVIRLESVSKSTGHEPARFDGDFPVWHHEYTAEEIAAALESADDSDLMTATYGAKSGWKLHGTRLAVGKAVYYRNYSY